MHIIIQLHKEVYKTKKLKMIKYIFAVIYRN